MKSSKKYLILPNHVPHEITIEEKVVIKKNDSWVPSELSKLTSLKYPRKDAFSGMNFLIFTNIAPLIMIVLTKYIV